MAALVLQSVARRPAISLSRVPHETVGRAYVCLKYPSETSVHSNDLSRGGGGGALCCVMDLHDSVFLCSGDVHRSGTSSGQLWRPSS